MQTGVYSTTRSTPGGTPQGTKTGNFLFYTATRQLDDPAATRIQRASKSSTSMTESVYATPPTSPSDTLSPTTSPLGGFSKDIRNKQKLCIRDTSDESDASETEIFEVPDHEPPPRWQPQPLKRVKFVDDPTACGKIDATPGIRHCTTKKEKWIIPATECQSYLSSISERAAESCMLVNQSKTQMLCISTAINSNLRSSIEVDGKQMISGDTLKVIGFTFGCQLGAGKHVSLETQIWCPSIHYTTPE